MEKKSRKENWDNFLVSLGGQRFSDYDGIKLIRFSLTMKNNLICHCLKDGGARVYIEKRLENGKSRPESYKGQMLHFTNIRNRILFRLFVYIIGVQKQVGPH